MGPMLFYTHFMFLVCPFWEPDIKARPFKSDLICREKLGHTCSETIIGSENTLYLKLILQADLGIGIVYSNNNKTDK